MYITNDNDAAMAIAAMLDFFSGGREVGDEFVAEARGEEVVGGEVGEVWGAGGGSE